MKRLSLALGALAIACAAASPARADYSIVRWSWGDCKIWYNTDPLESPLGGGWTLLASAIPTYDIARAVLEDMYRQGACR